MWLANGVLFAFVILAMFSIGPLLFPAMIVFWLAAVISNISQKRPIKTHKALTMIAAVFQTALIGLFYLIFRSQ